MKSRRFLLYFIINPPSFAVLSSDPASSSEPMTTDAAELE